MFKFLNLISFILVFNIFFCVEAKAESYTFLKLLGEGETSQVYLAKSQSGDQVAIKRMRSKEELNQRDYPIEYLNCLFLEDGSSRLAQDEFAIGQKLKHSNLTKMHELYTQKEEGTSRTYLVMELIEGKTLDHIQKGMLSEKQALENALELIDVLTYALKEGYVHDDLYSANVMIDQSGHLKLIDLNSFSELDELLDEEFFITHREYLAVITSMLINILNQCSLPYSHLINLKSKLEGCGTHPSAGPLDQPLLKNSVDLTISCLKEMVVFLNNQEHESTVKF